MADRKQRQEARARRQAAADGLRPATPASEWNVPDRTVWDLDLPSGNVVHVQQVDLLDLLASGAMPDKLTQAVVQIIEASRGEGLLPTEAGEEGDDGDRRAAGIARFARFVPHFPDLHELAGIVAVRALVNPPVVDAASAKRGEGITLDRLDFEDRMAIFGEVMAGADALLPFREAAQGDVGPVLAGEPVGDATE